MKTSLKKNQQALLNKTCYMLKKIQIPEIFSLLIYIFIYFITFYVFKKEIFLCKFIITFILFSIYCVFKKIAYQLVNRKSSQCSHHIQNKRNDS
jgi:hypothetical protein